MQVLYTFKLTKTMFCVRQLSRTKNFVVVVFVFVIVVVVVVVVIVVYSHLQGSGCELSAHLAPVVSVLAPAIRK